MADVIVIGGGTAAKVKEALVNLIFESSSQAKQEKTIG